MRTDLTTKEQACARAALQFLRTRCGGWGPLGKALGFSEGTLSGVGAGSRPPTASMAVRVARLASVGVDDVLQGRFPAPRTCPYCGHMKEEASDV
jgi:hypothetical protein